MDMNAPFKKETGFRHLIVAASYSLGGFLRVLQEPAFRHEIAFFVFGLLAFAITGASLLEFLVLTVLFLIMFGFEALNTAVEELVDRVSPERSQMGKHAKDLGSFAVFCMLVAAGLFIAYVLFT